METVVPLAVLTGQTTSAPQPTAQITAPPPDLQRLAVGAKLDALVLQGMSKGLAEIDTHFGKLQLSTNFPLLAVFGATRCPGRVTLCSRHIWTNQRGGFVLSMHRAA